MKTDIYYDPFELPINLSKKIFIQIFTSTGNIEEEIKPMINEIKSKMPNAAIIGTSTSSIIDQGKISNKNIVISVTEMESSFAHTMIVEKNDKFQKTIKTKYNALLRKRKDRKLNIVFGTTNVNGDEVLESIISIDHDVCVAGGLAETLSNTGKEKCSFVFNEEGITTDGFVLAMFYGEQLKFDTDIDFDWIPMGHAFTVTKSENNRVFELDNVPIKDVYKKYLGNEIVELIDKNIEEGLQYPILIDNKDVPVARAIIGQDEVSYTYAGNLKKGKKVFFGFANIDADKEDISKKTKIKRAETIFLYSCVVRKTLFGKDIENESKPFANISKVLGFYTLGEFYHYNKNGLSYNRFLNQTFTVLGLRENDKQAADNSYQTIKRDTESRQGGVRRRAMNHFVQTVTAELSQALEKKKLLIEEERELRKVVNFQASKSSLHQTMQILKTNILYNSKQINASVLDVYFKDNIKSLTSKDIMEMKSQVEVAQKKTTNILDAFSSVTEYNNDITEFSLFKLFENIHTIFSLPLIENNISFFPLFRSDDDQDFIIKSRKAIILQAIIPIFLNAIEAIKKTKEDGKITVELSKIKNGYTIEISDNGIGYKGDLENFFKYRKIEKNQSSGVSLYLVKNSIENALCGKISVINNSERGLTLHLNIPNLNA